MKRYSSRKKTIILAIVLFSAITGLLYYYRWSIADSYVTIKYKLFYGDYIKTEDVKGIISISAYISEEFLPFIRSNDISGIRKVVKVFKDNKYFKDVCLFDSSGKILDSSFQEDSYSISPTEEYTLALHKNREIDIYRIITDEENKRHGIVFIRTSTTLRINSQDAVSICKNLGIPFVIDEKGNKYSTGIKSKLPPSPYAKNVTR